MKAQIKNLVMNKYVIILLILVSIISCINPLKHDDYIILNQIISLKNISKNDTLYLLEKGKYNTDCLKNYYIYKYDKEKYDALLLEFEKQKRKNVEEGNLSKKYSKYLKFGFKHVNCVNDSIIDKNTLTYLKSQKDSIFWDKNRVNYANVVIVAQPKKPSKFGLSYKEKYPQISISKPLYNKSKDIAIAKVHINFSNSDIASSLSELLTFKKKNNKWQLINKITTHH